jgi:hypothetical protein
MRRIRKKHFLFATFDDFDKAKDVVGELNALDDKEDIIENIELYSPIEHPEVEDMLGEFHQPIQRFSFFGGITGTVLGFIFAAGVGQAMFTVQPQGGKSVIVFPPDIVIAYEMTILLGVLSTVAAFLLYSGLPRRVKSYYDHNVGVDQIGIEVETDPANNEKIRATLEKCGALEVRELTQ